MKFFEPNEKRTTVSVYIFLVALFCVFCVIVGINIHIVPVILGYIMNIIRPIIYGLILAFVLNPLVKFTEEKLLRKRKEKRLGFKRVLSVIIVYAAILSLVALFFVTAIPDIAENYGSFMLLFSDSVEIFQGKVAEVFKLLPGADSTYAYYNIIPDLRKSVSDNVFSDTLRNVGGFEVISKSAAQNEVKELFGQLTESLKNWITDSLPSVFSSAVSIITGAKNILLAIVLSIYFLIGEDFLIGYISKIASAWLPSGAYKRLSWIFDKGKQIFRDYIIVRGLDCISVGILTYTCLSIFRTPYASFLSAIIGFASFFPFIGPIVGILIGSLIITIVNFKYIIIFLAVAVGITILDSRYIEPLLSAGKQDTLSAFWVFTSIIVMGGFFGLVGILIGIPLFAFIYAIIKELAEERLKKKSLPDNTFDWFVTAPVPVTENPEEQLEDVQDIKEYFTEKQADDEEDYQKMKESLNKAYSSAKGFIEKFKKKK